MRPILKTGTGNYHLNQAHLTPPATTDAAKSRWSSFGYKADLLSILTDEQSGLCSYSEINPAHFGIGVHNEHIQPKSRYPQRTFDYHNLVMSALSSDDLKHLNRVDQFAGNAKGSNYDPNLFISPLQPNCQDFFAYLSDGRVVPRKDLNATDEFKATYTIGLLNLNCAYLTNKRKNWIDELDELIDEHIKQGWSLADLQDIYLKPCNQQLYSFYTANQQRFAA
ncbi:retron system putative HNH endonuclease [Thiomicrorhabdus sp. Milos-T2]|uniref:retron system putative HNH endonuclease n=1 Tax=Thiomicrorhabdus sp. Milos-T2 TaxID=90814 RepID=UPI00068CE17A|nr:retron system putative HNH endonuclease [Thiomicrorhabdus sp. Milos-T2]